MTTELSSDRKQRCLDAIMKTVLPYVKSHPEKIIFAHIMGALKMEGVIGETMTKADLKMVCMIKDAMYLDKKKRDYVLKSAQHLLTSSTNKGG